MAAVISFGAIQRSFVPYVGASGATCRRPVSASIFMEDVPGEFGRGFGENVVELGEDAAACGRGDRAALGHRHADCRTEPERPGRHGVRRCRCVALA
ncbi:hypothetical protein ACFYO5_37755 [Streptomyces sp. NPDC006259]|uniref:hypothetical protein n=1 Tax=Streptomyces sp. NPDC006259 TaxID=3364740 RepID=UPI00369893BE